MRKRFYFCFLQFKKSIKEITLLKGKFKILVFNYYTISPLNQIFLYFTNGTATWKSNMRLIYLSSASPLASKKKINSGEKKQLSLQ